MTAQGYLKKLKLYIYGLKRGCGVYSIRAYNSILQILSLNGKELNKLKLYTSTREINASAMSYYQNEIEHICGSYAHYV